MWPANPAIRRHSVSKAAPTDERRRPSGSSTDDKKMLSPSPNDTTPVNQKRRRSSLPCLPVGPDKDRGNVLQEPSPVANMDSPKAQHTRRGSTSEASPKPNNSTTPAPAQPVSPPFVPRSQKVMAASCQSKSTPSVPIGGRVPIRPKGSPAYSSVIRDANGPANLLPRQKLSPVFYQKPPLPNSPSSRMESSLTSGTSQVSSGDRSGFASMDRHGASISPALRAAGIRGLYGSQREGRSPRSSVSPSAKRSSVDYKPSPVSKAFTRPKTIVSPKHALVLGTQACLRHLTSLESSDRTGTSKSPSPRERAASPPARIHPISRVSPVARPFSYTRAMEPQRLNFDQKKQPKDRSLPEVNRQPTAAGNSKSGRSPSPQDKQDDKRDLSAQGTRPHRRGSDARRVAQGPLSPQKGAADLATATRGIRRNSCGENTSPDDRQSPERSPECRDGSQQPTNRPRYGRARTVRTNVAGRPVVKNENLSHPGHHQGSPELATNTRSSPDKKFSTPPVKKVTGAPSLGLTARHVDPSHPPTETSGKRGSVSVSPERNALRPGVTGEGYTELDETSTATPDTKDPRRRSLSTLPNQLGPAVTPRQAKTDTRNRQRGPSMEKASTSAGSQPRGDETNSTRNKVMDMKAIEDFLPTPAKPMNPEPTRTRTMTAIRPKDLGQEGRRFITHQSRAAERKKTTSIRGHRSFSAQPRVFHYINSGSKTARGAPRLFSPVPCYEPHPALPLLRNSAYSSNHLSKTTSMTSHAETVARTQLASAILNATESPIVVEKPSDRPPRGPQEKKLTFDCDDDKLERGLSRMHPSSPLFWTNSAQRKSQQRRASERIREALSKKLRSRERRDKAPSEIAQALKRKAWDVIKDSDPDLPTDIKIFVGTWNTECVPITQYRFLLSRCASDSDSISSEDGPSPGVVSPVAGNANTSHGVPIYSTIMSGRRLSKENLYLNTARGNARRGSTGSIRGMKGLEVHQGNDGDSPRSSVTSGSSDTITSHYALRSRCSSDDDDDDDVTMDTVGTPNKPANSKRNQETLRDTPNLGSPTPRASRKGTARNFARSKTVIISQLDDPEPLSKRSLSRGFSRRVTDVLGISPSEDDIPLEDIDESGPLALWIAPGYDVYAICFQECISSNAGTVISNFCSKINGQSYVELDFPNRISGRGDGAAVHGKATMVSICVRAELLPDLVQVHSSFCYSFNVLNGSKGCVAVLLEILGEPLLVIGCHLTPANATARELSRQTIRKKLCQRWLKVERFSDAVNHVIWTGDFNFRLREIDIQRAVQDLLDGRHAHLQTFDEIRDSVWASDLAEDGFTEMPIEFYPTYKKRKNRPSINRVADPEWVFNEYAVRHKTQWYRGGRVKDRMPAWTDRVLKWTTQEGPRQLLFIEGTYCASDILSSQNPILESDHSPVGVGMVLQAISRNSQPPSLLGDFAYEAPL